MFSSARRSLAARSSVGLIAEALHYQAERVAPTTPDLVAVFRMGEEFIDNLKRIYSLAKLLAKLLLRRWSPPRRRDPIGAP